MDKKYYITDLITDILSGGGSSRLYHILVKEKNYSAILSVTILAVLTTAYCYRRKLVKGIKMEDAEKAVDEELEKMKKELVSEIELEKVKNKTESTIAFEDMSVMNRANSLAFYELLGDAELMNTELEKYSAVTTADILDESKDIFRKETAAHYIIIQITDK
jgi:predicted Zn-dependent peptidase